VVLDGCQGKGLGTILLEALLAAAAARGSMRFRAYVLADNLRMLDLLRRFTNVQERSIDSGVSEPCSAAALVRALLTDSGLQLPLELRQSDGPWAWPKGAPGRPRCHNP
jgi:hypothetical protein